MAAAIALVAAGARILAVRAGAPYVAVGQEPHTVHAVGQQSGIGINITQLLQTGEKILHDALVVFSMRGGEQVERDAQALPSIQELGMEPFQHFLRLDVLLVGADGNRRAVGIGTGNHQDFIAFHPVVACENVGSQIAAGNMAHVQRAIGVRPGNPDENPFRQGRFSSIRSQRDR